MMGDGRWEMEEEIGNQQRKTPNEKDTTERLKRVSKRMTSSSVIAVPLLRPAWVHPSLPMQTYLCPSFLAGYSVGLDPDDRRGLL